MDPDELMSALARVAAGETVLLKPPAGAVIPVSGAFGNGGRLGVWSSGTTGEPKLVWKTCEELEEAASASDRVRGWSWATCFDLASFAGVQVAVQARVSGGKLFRLCGSWEENWGLLAENRIEAVCCTPTFLDLMIRFEPAGALQWQPRQVTLGGETLRAATGDRFRARFPDTRFTNIYASAELGVLLKTHRLDGWFELPEGGSGVELRDLIDGVGEVFVRRGGGWIGTGDLAEQKGGLLRVIGRASAVANVGGVKVNLEHVAELAERVPGVRTATAFVERSDVTGEIVGLRYSLDPIAESASALEQLQSSLRGQLPKPAWPRRWIEAEPELRNGKAGEMLKR